MAKKKLMLIKLLPILEKTVQASIRGLLKDLGIDEETAEVRRVGIDSTEKDFELDEGSRTAIQYVGTRSIDRDGDIILPKGAILNPFKENPVVLWTHNYSEPAIGRDLTIRADTWGLLAKTEYSDGTERARDVFALKQKGFLKTSSVGFIPTKTAWRGSPEFDKEIAKLVKKFPEDYPDTDGVYSVITEHVLLEHSDVNVPSNPDALVMAVSKGKTVISEIMLKDLGIDVEDLRTEGQIEDDKLKEFQQATYELLIKDSLRYQAARAEGNHVVLIADCDGMMHRIVEDRHGDGIHAVYAYKHDDPSSVQLWKILFDADKQTPEDVSKWVASTDLDVKDVEHAKTTEKVVSTPSFAPLKKMGPPSFKRLGKANRRRSTEEIVADEVKKRLELARGKV